jgi:NAD+ synthase (glutamine-hydrolysing)
MLKALKHPAAEGEPVYDVTYENVQAGARTSFLFRLANHKNALVVGTGDLSELALGWTTYGVGDQMAHYSVNASVPKTLIQHLIRWVADTEELGAEVAPVLRSILDTEISPELVPMNESDAEAADGEAAGDQPAQRSEDVVGPYPLQDFHLYYVSRYGFRPSKVAFLAHSAWGPGTAPASGDGLDESSNGSAQTAISDDRAGADVEYDLKTLKHWLEVFIRRFIQFSQFKRSALPNAPKVGSGGSLSPRGDWRAPSDASAEAWLKELEEVPDEMD